MDFQSMSDKAILAELGARIQRRRLALNITQIDLVNKAGVARKVIQNIEHGSNSSIKGFIRTLRALGSIDVLDQILPVTGPSPLELAKLKGRQRHYASGRKKKDGLKEGSV
ncbi:MAG: transcriptional regulator [Candidatus Omnitrophica bacterium]|nr:transcriptional regulator [Candidatus Omnitrophota bacterium]